MTARYSSTLRNAQNDAITAAIGASGLLKIYDGTQPATGGTVTTLLVTLTLNATFAPASSAGVLTANAITSGTAVATSTATWGRITTSGGAFVIDVTVGTSGTDVVIATAAIVSGATVSCSSLVVTAGNP